MVLQLFGRFIGEKIDNGIQVFGFLARSEFKFARFKGHFARLPMPVDGKNEMGVAIAFEMPGYPAESALSIAAERVGGLDVPKGYRDGGLRCRAFSACTTRPGCGSGSALTLTRPGVFHLPTPFLGKD